MIRGAVDTHTLLWYLFRDPRLSDDAFRFLEQPGGELRSVAVSSISLVEIVYLEEKRRVPEGTLAEVRAQIQLEEGLFQEIPVDERVVSVLPSIERHVVPDMPDRIIAATALSFEVPLLTRDAQIRRSRVETLW